jgi:hypothetical protein
MPVMRSCLDCRRLIPSGSRCVDCQRARWRQRNQTRPRYEVELYGSAAWHRLASSVVLGADRCHWCGTSAYVVKLTADHILTVREHPELATEESNVVASCRSCQEKRKARPDPRTWADWEGWPGDASGLGGWGRAATRIRVAYPRLALRLHIKPQSLSASADVPITDQPTSDPGMVIYGPVSISRGLLPGSGWAVTLRRSDRHD